MLRRSRRVRRPRLLKCCGPGIWSQRCTNKLHRHEENLCCCPIKKNRCIYQERTTSFLHNKNQFHPKAARCTVVCTACTTPHGRLFLVFKRQKKRQSHHVLSLHVIQATFIFVLCRMLKNGIGNCLPAAVSRQFYHIIPHTHHLPIMISVIILCPLLCRHLIKGLKLLATSHDDISAE